MIQPIDGPAKQYKLSVTTAAIVRVLKPSDAIEYEERKVVTLQPLDSSIRVYFADEGVVPSVATVAADGFFHFKKAKETYEAAATQIIYILAENSTTGVIAAERA